MNTSVLKIIELFFFVFSAPLFGMQKVVLNPACDARDPGRKLAFGYERGVTLAIAEFLEKELAQRYGVRTFLSRRAGETLLPFQAASLSNRINADFFFSIHVYHHHEPKPTIRLYHLLYHPLIDRAPRPHDPFEFISVYSAHYAKSLTSHFYATSIETLLKNDIHSKKLSCEGVLGIPLRPLIGVCAPAVACEIGICNDDQWMSIRESLVDSLAFLKTPLAS